MLDDIDLTQLSELSTRDKSFLSLYLSGPNSIENLDRGLDQVRRVLKSNETEKDERGLFEENVKVITEYLQKNPLESGSLCIFSCWGLDFFEAHQLPVPVEDIIWFDSSPYIRPLAELKEEYENVAVVIADNKKARIFLISSAIADDESTIEGNIKNHVRKGGWSQQRYERRRDKQLLLYSREIVAAIMELEKTESFRRILLVGGKEALQALFENLPQRLKDKVAQKAIDLRKGEGTIQKEIMELFFEQERQSEIELWEKIRSEYLRDGLGVASVDDVLHAVESGQAEEIIIDRDFKAQGKRCRTCENLISDESDLCPKCGSDSLFEVDLVNEIVELAKRSSASVDFCDSIQTLKEAGNIAAFLRYRTKLE